MCMGTVGCEKLADHTPWSTKLMGVRARLTKPASAKGKMRPPEPQGPPPKMRPAEPKGCPPKKRLTVPKPRVTLWPAQPDVPPPAHLMVNAWKQRANDAAAKFPPPVKRAPAACRLLSTSSSSSSFASSNSCVDSRMTLRLCRDQYLQDLV